MLLLILFLFIFQNQILSTLIYTTRYIKPYENQNISISNCDIKSSKLMLLINCEKYSILMKNQELLREPTQLNRYIINESVIGYELLNDYTIIYTEMNNFFVFYLDKQSIMYYSFFIQDRNLRSFVKFKALTYENFIILNLLKENYEFFFLFNIMIDPKNLHFVKENSILIDKNEIFLELEPEINFLNSNLNQFSGEIEIKLISKKNIIMFKSEKIDFLFIFEKRINLENYDFLKIYKNIYVYSLTEEIIIYNYNEFSKIFELLCKIDKKEINIIDNIFYLNIFEDEDNKNSIDFIYLTISIPKLNIIYFHTIYSYKSYFISPICKKLDFNLAFPFEYSNFIGLGSNIQLVYLNANQEILFSYNQTTNQIKKNRYLLISHNDPSQYIFLLYDFCEPNEEYNPSDHSCTKCKSNQLTNSFQGKCSSCPQLQTNLIKPPFCQNCDLSTNNLYTLNKNCEISCNQNNELYYYTKCEDKSKYDKCSSIYDCYNCTFVPFCNWKDNLCVSMNKNQYELKPESYPKCENHPICSSNNLLKNNDIISLNNNFIYTEKNSYCNWNVVFEATKPTNYRFSHIEIVIEEGFVPSNAKLEISFCFIINEKEPCKLIRLNLNFSEPQSINYKEKSNSFIISLNFKSHTKINTEKFHIKIEQLWGFIDPWDFKLNYVIILVFFILILVIIIIIKRFERFFIRELVVLRNFYNNESHEQRFSRLLRKKLIKKEKFSENKNDFEQNECPFCLEKFLINDELIKIKCKHIFHLNCFSGWNQYLTEEIKCPICRRDLNEERNESINTIELT